jgi:DNA-binding LacI/PurR family transcriptional regulator
MLAADSVPTGLFIAEDRLLPAMDLALRARAARFGGDGRKFEIISCNNEQPHFVGLQDAPATIDIRPESIGRLGVEQLLWRMRNLGVPERVRVMVEPVLIEPETGRA